ncbi:MAG: hypothetical protein ACREBE_19430 [bacterium]
MTLGSVHALDVPPGRSTGPGVFGPHDPAHVPIMNMAHTHTTILMSVD